MEGTLEKEVSSMEDLKKWGFIFGISLLSLIFSVASIFTPWWRITYTTESQITGEVSVRVEYGLFQTVSASKTTKVNKTYTSSTNRNVSFANLTGNDADKNALSSVFSNTFILITVSSALVALTAVLIFVSGFRKPMLISYAKFAGITAAILLVVTSFYFVVQMPPAVSKLTNVIPDEISSLSGNAISEFWGSMKQWIWGPAFGWFLAFTAFLLNAGTSTLVNTLYRQKVK